MKINIPLGSKIDTTQKHNEVRIRIPQTSLWIIGIRKENKKWDAYLFDPENNDQYLIKKDATTESFARFSGIILKTPFPFEGKRAQSPKIIIKHIKKIIKTKCPKNQQKKSEKIKKTIQRKSRITKK